MIRARVVNPSGPVVGSSRKGNTRMATPRQIAAAKRNIKKAQAANKKKKAPRKKNPGRPPAKKGSAKRPRSKARSSSPRRMTNPASGHNLLMGSLAGVVGGGVTGGGAAALNHYQKFSPHVRGLVVGGAGVGTGLVAAIWSPEIGGALIGGGIAAGLATALAGPPAKGADSGAGAGTGATEMLEPPQLGAVDYDQLGGVDYNNLIGKMVQVDPRTGRVSVY